MPYMIAVSLEMSDEPNFYLSAAKLQPTPTPANEYLLGTQFSPIGNIVQSYWEHGSIVLGTWFPHYKK